MSEVVRFELARVNRGRHKICICTNPCYEVDMVNRIVSCESCGAVVDAFDALVSIAERYERLEETQERMIKKAQVYQEEADKEFKRLIRNRIFREMNANYKAGLFPICPKCSEIFDPANIREWTRMKQSEIQKD